MSDTAMEPKSIARAVAVAVADEEGQVGDFVEAIGLEDGVTDFRFEAHVRGYEGWQWSVTMYHDVELDHWTVNESSLVPTDKALRPPKWIPWKDRLEPGDLAVTDSIGTDPDDPRMEDGFRRTRQDASEDAGADDDTSNGMPDDGRAADQETAPDAKEDDGAIQETGTESIDEADGQSATSEEDVDEAVEEFDLSRRHVMTPLGRSQTAKRWYEGPHGPKSLSTKTSDGNPCSTCGFFIPLKGELNLLFGVCANKWSPDDGRVVSVDHGCGEHSEIAPPEPSHLWVQSKPAFDDMHIDIIAQAPRDERGSVELIESLSSDDEHNPNEDEEGSEADIEANTIDDDASQEEVLEHTSSDDEPEVEATVEIDGNESEPTKDSTRVDGETDMASEPEDTAAHEPPVAVENASEDTTGKAEKAFESESAQSPIPDQLTESEPEAIELGLKIGKSAETASDTTDAENETPAEEQRSVQDEENEETE
ncbi:DUF3027 domain-containing protein [Bifidobacterium sp.]|uniref:DUF3027 domain-containing protein n=1 Tax=Bifidobacterium sp. TaxID=41200 RepID=UPI003D7D1C09